MTNKINSKIKEKLEQNIYFLWCFVCSILNMVCSFFLFCLIINILFRYNKSSVADGVAAVLNSNLDSFIYDGTVLDYLVAQDEDCRLMIVGSWYAMTGNESANFVNL